jgi:hypothetical protein
MKRDVVVLLNATSGGGNDAALAARIAGLFDGAGASAEVRLVHGGDDLVATLQAAVARRPDVIVAGGGDGTVSTVAAGMIWRGRCDSGSSHRISAMLRATGSAISAVFEIYHITGTVSMETSTRVQLADAASHPSTVPGSKVYYVQFYPDSFTYFSILVSGEGEVGFSLSIFPGDDRQVCYELDPSRAGKAIST